MSVRVLVVDDEPPARRKVIDHLREEEGVVVVGESGDGVAAVEALRRLAPDLVFLDVRMPGLDGFEVIEAVGTDEMPPVVFVTAFDDYALQAFEVEAVDYLLKPFDRDRFRRAFERARRRLLERGSTAGADGMDRLLAAVQSRRPLERIVVSERGRVLFVPLGEVTHFTAEGNYVRVSTPTGGHLVRHTLAGLEARLDPSRFARIHRSQIVAKAAIRELRPWAHGDYDVVLETGERLRLSRRYRASLLGDGG